MKTLPKHKKLNTLVDNLPDLEYKERKDLKHMITEAVEEAFLAGEKQGITESADLADKLIDERLKYENLLH
jgi:hypothetical protein